MSTMSLRISRRSQSRRQADMKPSTYGPFPYSPIINRPKLEWPNGAQLALWIIPNIEFFSLMEKVPAGAGGSNAPAPDVPQWAVRDYGNRVGVFRHDGDARPLRHPRHGRAQQRIVHPPSRDHRGRRRSSNGSGWATTRATPAGSMKPSRARSRASSRMRSTRSRRRPAGGRSAGSAPACKKPGIRSTCWWTTASNTSPTGSTTISPTR